MDTTINSNQGPAKKKHPPGLYLLFMTEMWERYSYYGMRGILVLYLTAQFISGGLGMSDEHALGLYGLYTSAVYLTPLLGGYLTDHFMGLRTAITIGGTVMAIGDFSLFAFHSEWGLYFGLACLIIGNGFFKPNISTMVGELYSKNDIRKDSAFTIFYMGINLGALFSPLVAGYLYGDLFHSTSNGIEHFGYNFAFLASSIGMIIGQLLFNILGKKYLGDLGKKPARSKDATETSSKAQPLTKHEKHRIGVIFILAVFVIMFWVGFEQAGASFTLYTQKFIDRTILGYQVPTSWFQSLNPLFILLLAPVVSAIWIKLSKTKRGDFSIPTKMAFGLMLLGLGFMVMITAVSITGSNEANITMKASALFMVFTYLLHTLGELCLSPIGLSLVSKMSPVKYASFLMGIWFLSNAAANYLAAKVGILTTQLGYFEIYLYVGIVAMILGVVLLCITKPIQKLMHLEDLNE
ncbi:peptide MFS transporter [Tuberibacillus sp. Marseille-P3662]|uniref:peptide MFS transporter n=1 Tax=Tuberibacillus sp. Marseille-P3662 TaxID=1965358 RepID=UPI000A1C9023|nr:peptide MFS transporter [Tuberibacillus sp. Marseille-P3662]